MAFCTPFQLPSTSSYTTPNHRIFHAPVISLNLRPSSSRCSVVTSARRRSSSKSSSSIPSSKKKKQGLQRNTADKDEDIEEDAFEALFKQLEEDLKNDGLSFDDDDDDDDEITEEDLIKLERELEEALADDELLGLLDDTEDEKNEVGVKGKTVMNKKGTTVSEVIEKEIEISNLEQEEEKNRDEVESEYEGENGDEDVDEDEDGDEGEDEGPLELKRWQLRRLAYAVKDGRRKTSIKNLAADLCLDRAIVLELLRDPPPDLLMLSASLPDKAESRILEPVIQPEDAILLASERDAINAISAKVTKKVPVHQMQNNWSAQKRLKKVHIETLERVYRRSKRPTNAMISNIVHVTKVPRKKVLKWFEDKRVEDGVPKQRLPYQRDGWLIMYHVVELIAGRQGVHAAIGLYPDLLSVMCLMSKACCKTTEPWVSPEATSLFLRGRGTQNQKMSQILAMAMLLKLKSFRRLGLDRMMTKEVNRLMQK